MKRERLLKIQLRESAFVEQSYPKKGITLKNLYEEHSDVFDASRSEFRLEIEDALHSLNEHIYDRTQCLTHLPSRACCHPGAEAGDGAKSNKTGETTESTEDDEEDDDEKKTAQRSSMSQVEWETSQNVHRDADARTQSQVGWEAPQNIHMDSDARTQSHDKSKTKSKAVGKGVANRRRRPRRKRHRFQKPVDDPNDSDSSDTSRGLKRKFDRVVVFELGVQSKRRRTQE